MARVREAVGARGTPIASPAGYGGLKLSDGAVVASDGAVAYGTAGGCGRGLVRWSIGRGRSRRRR